MKTVIISLILILFVGSGCVEPKQDNENSGVSIIGVVNAGRFSGTEKACEFSDETNLNDRMECNRGSVTLVVVNDVGESIWLDGYQCNAIEYFVKKVDGKRIEYETTNCTSGIIVGNTYTFEGTLEERNDQWYMGKQQDEIWLLNAVTK